MGWGKFLKERRRGPKKKTSIISSDESGRGKGGSFGRRVSRVSCPVCYIVTRGVAKPMEED